MGGNIFSGVINGRGTALMMIGMLVFAVAWEAFTLFLDNKVRKTTVLPVPVPPARRAAEAARVQRTLTPPPRWRPPKPCCPPPANAAPLGTEWTQRPRASLALHSRTAQGPTLLAHTLRIDRRAV